MPSKKKKRGKSTNSSGAVTQDNTQGTPTIEASPVGWPPSVAPLADIVSLSGETLRDVLCYSTKNKPSEMLIPNEATIKRVKQTLPIHPQLMTNSQFIVFLRVNQLHELVEPSRRLFENGHHTVPSLCALSSSKLSEPALYGSYALPMYMLLHADLPLMVAKGLNAWKYTAEFDLESAWPDPPSLTRDGSGVLSVVYSEESDGADWTDGGEHTRRSITLKPGVQTHRGEMKVDTGGNSHTKDHARKQGGSSSSSSLNAAKLQDAQAELLASQRNDAGKEKSIDGSSLVSDDNGSAPRTGKQRRKKKKKETKEPSPPAPLPYGPDGHESAAAAIAAGFAHGMGSQQVCIAPSKSKSSGSAASANYGYQLESTPTFDRLDLAVDDDEDDERDQHGRVIPGGRKSKSESGASIPAPGGTFAVICRDGKPEVFWASPRGTCDGCDVGCTDFRFHTGQPLGCEFCGHSHTKHQDLTLTFQRQFEEVLPEALRSYAPLIVQRACQRLNQLPMSVVGVDEDDIAASEKKETIIDVGLSSIAGNASNFDSHFQMTEARMSAFFRVLLVAKQEQELFRSFFKVRAGPRGLSALCTAVVGPGRSARYDENPAVCRVISRATGRPCRHDGMKEDGVAMLFYNAVWMGATGTGLGLVRIPLIPNDPDEAGVVYKGGVVFLDISTMDGFVSDVTIPPGVDINNAILLNGHAQSKVPRPIGSAPSDQKTVADAPSSTSESAVSFAAPALSLSRAKDANAHEFVKAALHGDMDQLIERRRFVDVVDCKDQKWDITALQAAAGNGYVRCVRYLVTCKANINVQDKQGWTPLLLAARNGRAGVVTYLIRAGADISRVNNQKASVFTLAASFDKMSEMVSEAVKARADFEVETKKAIKTQPQPIPVVEWSSDDVADWVQTLDLSPQMKADVEGRFRAHRMTGQDLLQLSRAELDTLHLPDVARGVVVEQLEVLRLGPADGYVTSSL